LLIGMLTLVIGISKKNKVLRIVSFVIFIGFFPVAGTTGYKLINKSYNKVANAFKPRTGDEIYDALFGPRHFNCVKILNHLDQVVPKIDYAILLHFKTCPGEMKRILTQNEFISQKSASKDLTIDGPSATKIWFNPASMHDSLLIFTYKKDEYGNGQTLYTSLDSTEVFCIDIVD